MSNRKSTAAANAHGTSNAERASAHSTSAVENRRIDVKMMQNVLLIWLDKNIDENNKDYRNTIIQLRRSVNNMNHFTDGDQCIQFLENITDKKACMIISGSLGQHIVPRAHDMSQVDSIFIFCGNKTHHEQWAQKWPKIKGVFTEITPICEALKQAAQQCEHNAISISFMATGGDASNKNLDQLDSLFMYTQILKEILLTIQFGEQHIKEFINYCCDVFVEDDDELKNVKKLKRNYHDQTPIWWYTYECFLYPMLNCALRLMNIDIIIKMAFFIIDLHHQIEQLHNEQFDGHHSGKNFTVYRGQGISKQDFEKLTKTKGGLISFNNFLSTSKDRQVSLDFVDRAVRNPDLVAILFVMTIDPSKSTTPFACINGISCHHEENEVLFSMHTVFRIHDIKPMGGNNHFYQVDLTLTSDNDKDLRALTDRIREETFPKEEGWYRLGLFLLKMGQSAKAQQVYEVLLEQAANENEKGPIYHQIGWAKYNQKEYKEAITFYEKALAIKQKTLPSNHLDLAISYNNIGNVYSDMNEYSKALSSYGKALEIRQQSLPPHHRDLATSYNNIGLVYDEMRDYSRALSAHKKALEIKEKTLPSNHPDLAISYNNIGNVYFDTSDYPKALSFYEKAVDVRQKSLPPNHPDLAMSYSSIGGTYESMGNYSKARPFYERAVEIGQRSLPANDHRLQKWRKNLEDVKKKL